MSSPEAYYVRKPTPYVPNSRLPVLIYRGALPPNPTPDVIRAAMEPNHWIKGGVFKHYPSHHFHSLTHECYAVFKGRSRLLLGRGPLDTHRDEEDSDDDVGVQVTVNTGDAIVLPAGVAHCCLESEGDYQYVGLYPEGSPHWDNNFCKAGPEETQEKAKNASAVPLPEADPIFGGSDGPLVKIWKEALST